MTPSRYLRTTPPTARACAEISCAIDELAARCRDDWLRRRRAECAALRQELEQVALSVAELRRDYDPRLRSHVMKYSADQPRAPAGSPDGGQWTREGASSAESQSHDTASNGVSLPVQYAALDTGTRTDAAASAGPQYAGGIEDDDNENRAGGRRLEGTPAQEMRDDLAVAQYRSILAEVLRLDPTWKPSASFVDPESIEGDIAKLQAATEEAQEHLARLRALGFPRDPETRDVIPPTEPKTGNPRIDSTTQILMDIFRKIMDQNGPRPDLTPGQYGMLVHTKCAEAIRALNLPGIDTNDLERTFGVEGNDTYGSKYSVRPDVILRDDDGNIIAIYDFKTGRGLPEDQVIRYRYRTGSGRNVPVIELSRSRGALSKRE